jgi:hypothetical protein
MTKIIEKDKIRSDISLWYKIEEEGTVHSFVNKDGEECELKDATVMMVSYKGEDGLTYTYPESIKVAHKLALKKNYVFRFERLYSNFKIRPKHKIDERTKQVVHLERDKFETWCRKHFELEADFEFELTANSGHDISGNHFYKYDYNNFYIQGAFETWKAFNMNQADFSD